MPLVVYFDEVGNPTLNATDKDFPVFAIAMFICDSDHYINTITPRVNRLKFDWFGHEGHRAALTRHTKGARGLRIADGSHRPGSIYGRPERRNGRV